MAILRIAFVYICDGTKKVMGKCLTVTIHIHAESLAMAFVLLDLHEI